MKNRTVHKSEMTMRIIALRRENGYNQENFADEIGISLNTLKDYESERTEWKLTVIKNISLLFNVSTDYIIFGKEESMDTLLIKMFSCLSEKNKKLALAIMEVIESLNSSEV